MSRTKSALLLALPMMLLASTVADAGWNHFARSVFNAEKNRQKHPKSLTQTVVLPEDTAAPQVCAVYRNSVEEKNKGRVVATAFVYRVDGSVERLDFAGGVKSNIFLRCKETDDLLAGEYVDFEFDLRNMPRLEINGGTPEWIKVSGVVSTETEPTLETFDLAPAEEGGGWFHNASSVFLSDKKNQRHFKDLAQTVVVPEDVADPSLCVAYNNTTSKKKKGRVVASANVVRVDGTTEVLNFAGGVRDNVYEKCKAIGDLAVGDMVEFDMELRNMPRLKAVGESSQLAEVNGVISASGELTFEIPVDASDVPTPDVAPDPAAPPPTSGSGISADDQRAVSSLLMKTSKTQLWRPKGNSPAKWVVVGPKTVAISGNTLNLGTAGLGSTIAAAWNDYQRKQGGLPAGDLLDTRTINALKWYSAMNSSSGPTSVRRDSGGGYHADYYRPGRGSVITGGFGSVAATIEFLQREGL